MKEIIKYLEDNQIQFDCIDNILVKIRLNEFEKLRLETKPTNSFCFCTLHHWIRGKKPVRTICSNQKELLKEIKKHVEYEKLKQKFIDFCTEN